MEKDAEIVAHLEEKLATIALPYEALQYVQSFVARKKKHINSNTTSALVYSGCKKLVADGSPSDAGSLLVWYIEGGAGEPHNFHLEANEIEGSSTLYCDVDRLISLIKKLDDQKSVQICEKIYLPLLKIFHKTKIAKSSSLQERLNLLEDMVADVFESNKNWQFACKGVVRLEDMERLAKILDGWSNEGYATEKLLYFARAVLQLLSEGQAQLGIKLVKECSSFVMEEQFVDGNGSPYASLAIWHLTVILSDLLSITSRPGPDKTKIFKQLSSRYASLLGKTDPKLLALFNTTGTMMFGVMSEVPQSPLNLFDMLGGGMPSGFPRGGGGGAPPLDMAKMMQMMQQRK